MTDCICGTQPEIEDAQGRNPHCHAGGFPTERPFDPKMFAHLFRTPDVDIPTERDETKPCRPIYCAKHYGGDETVPCVRAYQCPEIEES